MKEANMGKVFTDYPFVDVLIYYVKQLAMYCIVKSETEASAAETLRTEYMGDLFIQSIEGTADWRLYDYNQTILSKIGLPANLMDVCIADPDNIPEEFREAAKKEASDNFLRNYIEENEYYRKIMGLPTLGDSGLLVPKEFRIANIGVDYNIPLHLMKDSAINILEERGIWDNILARYTDDKYAYLKYIKSGVDNYKARKAENFQLLFLPNIDNTVVKEKFQRRFSVNRAYALTTLYSEAHKFDSKYYDAWMTIFIIVQTMIDMISEVQDHIINLDVFDERCVRYIFQSHGIPYYNEIPLYYQVRMMRRLHELLKYKSTSKCMVDICSLFGFDDLRVFKYYLLRERVVDKDTEEYVFNYKTKKILDTDQKIQTHKEVVTGFTGNNIRIPFPSEGFLAKGGAMLVNLDGKRIREDQYEIVDGNLRFKDANILQGKTKLEFLFYSNDSFNENINELDKYKIITETKNFPITNKDQKVFNITFPVADYFKKGGIIFVTAGSTFIDQKRYTLDLENNTLTFNDDEGNWYEKGARDISIIYIHSDQFQIKSKVLEFTHPGPSQAIPSFDIPEPYKDYIRYGGEFFALQGSVLLPKDRYFIKDKNFSFVSADDKIIKDRTITFNNIYTEGNEVEMEESWFETKVDIPGIQDYKVTVPFENYTESGYLLEVFIDGNKVRSSEYTFLKNNIKIIDQTKVMRPGVRIQVHFVYAKDRTKAKISSLSIPIEKKTYAFKIKFPYDGYEYRHDKWYLTVDGMIIEPSKYKLTGNVLSFNDPQYYLTSKNAVEVKFIRYDENTYSIHVTEEDLLVRDQEQKLFTINYPFYNYERSGNGMIVTVGGVVVDPSRYTLLNNTIQFDETVVLDKGRSVHCIFVYNSVYDNFNNYIRSEYSLYDLANGSKIVKIPFPYDNFLESDNNNQMEIMCQDGTLLEENVDYEIIDDQAIFSDTSKILSHGDIIIFNFTYINAKKKEIYIEDTSKNYDLKFVKVPLKHSADNYLRDQSKYIDYDRFTEPDWLWVNEFNPVDIKNKILEKEFNYARTKYISIDTVMSMNNLSFMIPYFFNLFFDNYKLEDRLRLQLPNIKQDKNYKLSSVLCMLFSLSYAYYNIEDKIQDETVPIMYIQGFNFETDLAMLQNDILKKYGYTFEDLKIGEFEKHNSSTTIKGLMNMFEHNTKIYDTVVKGMYYADNKRIYDAYKAVYNALMIRKYSKKFFTTNGVDVARTYSEYLYYQDKDLYNIIEYAKSIGDDSERKKYITNMIMSVVGYIEIYLGSSEYRELFNSLPGIGIDYIKMYVSKVIDFFKSYKVEIAGLNTVYNFNNRYKQYIKPIDIIKLLVKMPLEDFELFYDGFEKYIIKSRKYDRVTQEDMIFIMRYFMKKFKFKDFGVNERDKKNKVKIFDKNRIHSVLAKYDDLRHLITKEVLTYLSRVNIFNDIVSDIFDIIKPRIKYKPKDKYNMIDRIYIDTYHKKP